MPAEVLQLTDLHLLADRNAALKGVRTRDSWNDVFTFVQERSRAGEWDFEYVFLTGDLAHDEQLATYEFLRESLGDWLPRCRLIPGNHDDRALIRKVFPELVPAGGEFINFSVESAGWRLIGLDSHVVGAVDGRIGEAQLPWLAAELSAHSALPTMLFVHHPPVPVHSAWLDRIGLRDAEAMIDVVRSFPQVRGICSGHVHQEFSGFLDGVRILTTPSTGVQFRPRQYELIRDLIPPGFRVFRLADADFESHVIRLPDTTRSAK